jgi:hypothetical protein
MRASKRRFCSSSPTSSQNLMSWMPVSTMYFSPLGQTWRKRWCCFSEQKPITYLLIHAPAQIGKHLVRVGHLNKSEARILEVDDHVGGHRQDDGVQNISHSASFAGVRQPKLLTRPQTRLTFFNGQYK